ncbi:hypothetical protein SAM23877_p100 (plasmid) [Streptomyces ambofaciens ATCC 23877]|uniref:Uncharacterized protein n=1 Tax=Streptomyces ambofaciens (strain ATCC 23877 / 3486 / DSM 40053 / JCM 4204 / NBRC 12836 / NRRL B-2516) TaxID=278992 RepID=A0A0K2B6B8_STRA7|nr:hypothetical protein [Streptomyces ambofaciens]AKZ60809.1 hypothetical protein SAM23877_p100 [Streptomyces ambofaciens ATCC 23877]
MSEMESRIASLEATNSDLRSENREIRREILRALRFIEKGDVGSAQTLMHRLSLSVAEK